MTFAFHVVSDISLTPPNVAFSGRRPCGRLGTIPRLFSLNGSPLASVIGQLQRLVGLSLSIATRNDNKGIPFYGQTTTCHTQGMPISSFHFQ
jgi:hypothetical protein